MSELPLNKIICADSLSVLKTFPDESVDCIITSPPYYGLRDYGTAKWEGGDENCEHEAERKKKREFHQTGAEGRGNSKSIIHASEILEGKCLKCGAIRIDQQIGLEKTLDEYLERMLAITAELKRVLKKTGTMWLNHGDSYGTGSGAGIRSGKQSTNRGTQTNENWQKEGKSGVVGYEKSLLFQNFRLAIRMCDEQGWILRNTIIWHKPNVMPSSVKDRFTVDYEPIFFFSKSKKYWFEPQYEPQVDMKFNYRKSQNNTKSEGIYKRGMDNLIKLPLGRNKRTVWKIPTQPFPEAHFATFPEDLVITPIKAGCPEMICKKCGVAREKIYEKEKINIRSHKLHKGAARESVDTENPFYQPAAFARTGEQFEWDVKFTGKYTDCGHNAGWEAGVVLDPFMGSGTVAIVAKKLKRNYIGIELNPSYIEIAQKRLDSIPSPLL